MDVLYESDLRHTDPLLTLADRASQADPPVPAYTVELVEGVTAQRVYVDDLITAATGAEWPLARLPAVDRALLRVAVYELACRPEVPGPVVIDEAVGLAAELSTEESPRFVNGVLSRLSTDLRGSPATPEPAP